MHIFRTTACAAVCLSVSLVNAQEERLTIDWIYGEEGKTAASVPQRAWLDDGRILIYDSRPAKSERTLEVVDSSNGRRRYSVDPEKALAGLNKLLSPDEPIEELGWPATVDPAGRLAVYEQSGDIVGVYLQTSDVVGIATEDAEEKSARFSPDGKWLAFIRDNDLFVRNIEDDSEKRLTTGATETLMNGTVSWVYWEELLGRVDQGYFWAPDSKSIAYLQTDDSGVGEMHYVDFEPNLPRLINQRHPKPGEANPRVRAGVVNLDNARSTWVDLGSYPYEYLARIKWLPDSTRLAVQTLDRPQTALDVFIAEAATGRTRHLLRETDPGWVNVHDDLFFLNDNERFIWRSERDGFAHLYMFDMNGDLMHQITNGEWALRSSGGLPGTNRAIAGIDEENETIYFTSLEKNTIERHLYRISMDGSDMQRLSVEDGSHAILFQPDGGLYLDEFSTLNRPPSLAIHDSSGEKLRTLAEHATLRERFALQNWEVMTVSARDGFEMPAMMLKPRYFDPNASYPAVIYVYAGPSAPSVVDGWRGRRGLYHQTLADNGVVVFYVDNRSAAGKSKNDANTITGQLYGPVELNDLLDGVAWLKSQPYIDAERVGVWGWSGGGAMTLQSMTSSEEFAAGAAVAPVSDWHYYDTIYTERYLKRPQDNEAGYESTSNAKRAGDLHGRLLLVHGTYDDNVHPQNSWAFSDGLIEAGITYDMMIYPMRKHGISDNAAQAHVYKTMLEFWRRNLSLGD